MAKSKAQAAMVERAAVAIRRARRCGRLLEQLTWPRDVEQRFFEYRARRLPVPTYAIDRERTRTVARELSSLGPQLRGSGALPRFLRRLVASHLHGLRMLLAVETPRFYALSCAIFGGARSMALDSDTTNLDLARHVGRRLGERTRSRPRTGRLDAAAVAQRFAARLAADHPRLELALVLDDGLSAKVMAGASRVRIRTDATFDELEVEGLYRHEVETHALTARNGRLQPGLPLLGSGGPRATRTQEGLAVFAELHGQALGVERLRKLVERVELVALAEDGASFLDVYRHLVRGLGRAPREAYLETMRVFRGARIEGGSPFTKDACYLSGLAEVYNFLRLCLTHGARELAEVLVSGRLALDDLDELVELRREGLLAPPRHLPGWLARWEPLVAYFAFTSFLDEIALPPLRRRYAAVRALVSVPQSDR